jgi:hypothetical protein
MTPAPGAEGSAGGSAPSTGSAGSTGQQPAPTGDGALGADTVAALQAVMAAEHAALWAYGLVAAYDPTASDTVTTMITSHQAVRDTAANLIVSGGATPVGPAPAYRTPAPVTDAKSALALALTIESDCAVAWRSVIGHTSDSSLRGTALSALTDCAMRMVTWRQTAKDAVVTVPFPGDPERNRDAAAAPGGTDQAVTTSRTSATAPPTGTS